jgi:EAL domain-containing protein (putative c-di-GMP-specific phosphodiesterase class I)
MDSFREPLDLDGRPFNAALSMGAARFPSDGLNFEDLLRCADMALRHARSGPRLPFQAFERRMRATVERNLWTSIELPKALREGSLFLEFQPMMRLSDRSTPVVEALARWTHPERGRVGPGEFVEAADEVGLTRELGHYVLDCAARQLAEWRQKRRLDVRIASNVSSPLLLSRNFLPELDEILARHALAPGDLQLEITEGALMADLEVASETLGELRRRGIQVAIDDFGTGYSSLAYLRELRADTIKIAKPFVDRLPGTAQDRRIVEVIVHLARALGMRTVAEGVETQEQFDALSDLDCDEVQGYLIARPMPVADLERWIANRSAGPNPGDTP